MTAAWDIVDDVFPGTQIVERRVAPRRPGRVPSSAVIAVVLAVSTAVSVNELSACLVEEVSGAAVAISREHVSRDIKSPPQSETGNRVDFQTARSAEQLAKSFTSFFKPASDHDEDDQVAFVFG
jgi:hypothetical protein